MRRRNSIPLIQFLLIITAILLLIGLFHLFSPSSPKKAVQSFYASEQAGNFGGAGKHRDGSHASFNVIWKNY